MWEEMVLLIAPHHPNGKRGRLPRGIEPMPQTYLMQQWFNLLGEGVEDAIYDSHAFRKLVGVDSMDEARAPGATPLRKFRELMCGVSTVGTRLIEAQSSTENAESKCGSETRQAKKVTCGISGNGFALEWMRGQGIFIRWR